MEKLFYQIREFNKTATALLCLLNQELPIKPLVFMLEEILGALLQLEESLSWLNITPTPPTHQGNT